MRVIMQVWQSIHEPRVKKTLAACAYLAAIMVGITTVLQPPASIEGVLGAVLTTAWGVCYLIGGLLGLGTVMQGWWWAERAGIYSIIAGALIYLGVVFYLHHTNDMGNRMPQYWALTMSLPLLAYRWVDIRKLPYEPRRR